MSERPMIGNPFIVWQNRWNHPNQPCHGAPPGEVVFCFVSSGNMRELQNTVESTVVFSNDIHETCVYDNL